MRVPARTKAYPRKKIYRYGTAFPGEKRQRKGARGRGGEKRGGHPVNRRRPPSKGPLANQSLNWLCVKPTATRPDFPALKGNIERGGGRAAAISVEYFARYGEWKVDR